MKDCIAKHMYTTLSSMLAVMCKKLMSMSFLLVVKGFEKKCT